MTENTKTRWRRAILKARVSGAVVKANVNVCCGTCVTADDLGMTEQMAESLPYAYFLGTQGRRVRFHDGEPHEKTNDVVYFSHDNGGGRAVADAFISEGFDVIWDGTDAKTVGVVLRARAT